MKKWIPKNTVYCHGCRWHRYIKTLYLHASPTTTKLMPPSGYTWSLCDYRDDCENKARCWTTPEYSCSNAVYRCEYLGITEQQLSQRIVEIASIDTISFEESVVLQAGKRKFAKLVK